MEQYESLQESKHQKHQNAHPETLDPLVDTPYEVENRPYRDVWWGKALVVLYATGIIGALFAWNNINPTYFKLSDKYLNDPQNCPLNGPENMKGRRLSEDGDARVDFEDFFAHASVWLVAAVCFSIGVGLLFLKLVKDHAEKLASFTIGFQLAVPLVVGSVLLLNSQVGQGLLFLGLSVLTYFVFYLWRREIGVAASLLSVAGHGLTKNASLIGFTIALNLSAVLLALPLLIAVPIGLGVGDVIPNPVREGREACVDEFGDGVMCCVWSPKPVAAVYVVLCMVVATWSIFTVNQIRLFVISGTVAQWYFSVPQSPVSGNLMRSLKHACTVSFGTNAFAGMVLTFTNMLKQQSAEAREEGQFSLSALLASCFAGIFEYLTKFATVFASISGKSLLTAGRTVTDLLARNFLDAFATTIWFPSVALSLASMTMAALWGLAAGAAYNYLHGDLGEKHHMDNAVILGSIVGLVTLCVLSFLGGLLLSVLDAVFVCFALDQDRHAVANSELFHALMDVAHERGIIVEDPDGILEYGNADAHTSRR